MSLLDALRRIANLCHKELLAILKDPRSRVILIGPAIVQTLVFGYAATFELREVPYALVDQSASVSSAALVAKLDGSGVFQRVANPRTPAETARQIDTQHALVVLHIGPRFEHELAAGEAATVQLLVDARNSNTAGSAVRYVNAVVQDFNAERRARAGLAAAPISVQTRAWYNPQLETRWNMVPALIAALSMLQTLLLTALSVAREREQGTFDQLLVTPMSPTEILIGKALPSMAVGLAQSTLILLVARFWFQIPLAGSPLTLYVGLLFFTLASVGVGLSISAVAASMQQAMLYAFVLLMPMMLLSGLTTPVRNMPALLQTLTYANPLRFAIDLVQRVYLEGVGLATVWPDLVPLTVIALLTLPLAGWLFRHRLV